MSLVEQIRKKYPHPSVCPKIGVTKRGYCVGGAVCLWAGRPGSRYPYWATVSDALQHLNPALSYSEASRLASAITDANDIQLFDRAWQLVDEALTYREEK